LISILYMVPAVHSSLLPKRQLARFSRFCRVHGSHQQTDRHRDTARYVETSVTVKGKVSLYSIIERRVPELIPVLGSQPAGDVSHKPGGRLPLLSARPPQPLRGLLPILLLGEQRHDGCEQLPKTVTRQRRDCNLNPGPSAPESSTLTTRLPSHPSVTVGRRIWLLTVMLANTFVV